MYSRSRSGLDEIGRELIIQDFWWYMDGHSHRIVDSQSQTL
jgi:hypothetical protein